MTLRLVGFMSLVLLICLASFALLMNSYHAEVMEGVTHTVTDVGKATLKTLELDPVALEEGELLALTEEHLGAARASGRAHEMTFEFKEEAEGSEGDTWVQHDVRRIMKETPEGKPMGVMVVSRASGSATPQSLAEISPGSSSPEGLIQVLSSRADCIIKGKEGSTTRSFTCGDEEAHAQIFISVEDVRAETDPSGATILTIPTWRQTGTWLATASPDPPPGTTLTASATVDIPSSEELKPAGLHAAPHPQEIRLPISTHEFKDQFAAFQRKTLLLFLGVFLVGTVFSASFAARFTRPVRRLDAGIRRLTEGDLDVEVEARGNDEIGRLGRAFNEMTSRLRASRERERDLTRREKLSSLGRLAAGVAHDVRNPLHSIGLTLQHLQETARPENEDRKREFDRSLGVIRQEIHRLDRLVGNFLQFARSDRRTRVPVDLAQLLRETVQLVEKEAERRGINVNVVHEGARRAFPADPESIRSSILNLVLNSFEAMTEGGTLTLSTHTGVEEIVLEVADTGRGIPQEDQEKVFEFDYTSREDGHGLGLAMVHQVVVEDHGGRVSLESRPGEGTSVKLAFPIEPDPQESPS